MKQGMEKTRLRRWLLFLPLSQRRMMSNKVTLCYRGLVLGVLEKTDCGYMYSSHYDNEQKARDSGLLTKSEYSLWYSKKRESKKLFPEFVEIINSCRRADIMELAYITTKDSTWEKIVKLSQLDWHTTNFYLQPFDSQDI